MNASRTLPRPAHAARRVPRQRVAGALGRVAVWAAVSCIAAFGAAGWLVSDRILFADPPSSLHEQRVYAAGPGWVRLSRDAESLQPGRWGLQWEGGFGSVGRVLASNAAGVVRECSVLAGRLPVGGDASVRGVPRNADPKTLLGLAFADVRVPGPLGTYPAWFVPGADTTWVVYVHGRGTTRAEALRSIGALASHGLPALVVTYRGDAGAPRPPGGYSQLGAGEWADLEAAVRYALAHGARRLVLFGYSMGGQVVLQFLARSTLAPRVAAVVLESPLLDWNATLAHRARAAGVPAPVLALGKGIAALRAGIDWRALGDVGAGSPLPAPVLLLHGRNDREAPFAASEGFARRHAGRVTFVPVEQGNHVEAWNVDPEGYRRTVAAWLAMQLDATPRR